MWVHVYATSKSVLCGLAPVEAVLFDIDGTVCDSDPVHYAAFREMLQEVRVLCISKEDAFIMKKRFRMSEGIVYYFFSQIPIKP